MKRVGKERGSCVCVWRRDAGRAWGAEGQGSGSFMGRDVEEKPRHRAVPRKVGAFCRRGLRLGKG